MKYPEMRSELLDYLEGLSNYSYQMSCWVNRNCPDDIENDELDYAVHFLFDDTALSSDPNKLIGYCLRNEGESRVVKEVCEAIEAVFSKYGYRLTDAEYIELPEWQSVIDRASIAVQYLKQDK